MTLREQFEAWHVSHFGDCGEGIFKRGSKLPEEYRDLRTQQEWDAYQAGHASGRDELLAALEEIEAVFQSSPQHGKLACDMVGIANAAIKKARGDA